MQGVVEERIHKTKKGDTKILIVCYKVNNSPIWFFVHQLLKSSMSLLTTASPYHSREDGSMGKGGKKPSNRRKATMPSLSSSIAESKKYMSQLIQNKEPQPSLSSSYYGAPIQDSYAYKSSEISDKLYPTLEENSSKNMLPHASKDLEEDLGMEKGMDVEALLQKNGALPPPSEMPSFYKKNKSQQSGIRSALQKLTGNKTITQEGMTDYSSSQEKGSESILGDGSGENHRMTHDDFEPPYIPTMPSFTLNKDSGNGKEYAPSPIDYLKPNAPNSFSDYSSSYSQSNYVVPPHLSQYSYPTMRGSQHHNAMMEQIYSMAGSENEKSNQLLLEKINYMIYLLEQQKKEKSKHTTEEFVLYSFLGVFVIYLADSFARSGRYIR